MATSLDDYLARQLGQALLRYAVQRYMFCQISGAVLDMRSAVLIDGSDNGLGMMVVTARVYDIAAETLAARLGDDIDIYDGRELFSRNECQRKG